MRRSTAFLLVICSVIGWLAGGAIAGLVLDGTGDYATIADNANLTMPDGDFTFGMWVKGANAGTSLDNLISWGDYQATPSFNFRIYQETHASLPGRFLAYLEDSDPDSVSVQSDSDDWADANWHHICMVRSSDTFYIYYDNAEMASGSMADVDAIDVAAAMHIGAYNGGAAYLFTGTMAEIFFVSGTAASEAQRASLLTTTPDKVFTCTWYFPLYDDSDADAGGLTMTLEGDAAVSSADHPDVYGAIGPVQRYRRGLLP